MEQTIRKRNLYPQEGMQNSFLVFTKTNQTDPPKFHPVGRVKCTQILPLPKGKDGFIMPTQYKKFMGLEGARALIRCVLCLVNRKWL